MSIPFVSVLMNNYNYGKFVKIAIESVLNQTYSNFELIIVDDGSEDDSIEQINSITSDKIVKIFQKNKGQAGAFNTGFKAAKGDIITFIDSDDIWLPNKLESIIKWHQLLEGDYSILQHNLSVWQNGEIIGKYKNILPSGDCFKEMKENRNLDYFSVTSGLAMKKEILSKVFPIPEEFRISADAYLMRASFIFGQVVSIPTCLAYYRKHQNAFFGNKNFDFKKFSSSLFYYLNKFYLKHNQEFELNYNPHKGKNLSEKREAITFHLKNIWSVLKS